MLLRLTITSWSNYSLAKKVCCARVLGRPNFSLLKRFRYGGFYGGVTMILITTII